MQDFGKNIGIRCPIEQIKFVNENGSTKVTDCYFKHGENEGKSRSLAELCKDLGVQLLAKIKPDGIREIPLEH